MKIRAITLTNVRRFAGQTATISGIGDGISVIAAPNEFGKSTFFDALQAIFFTAHGSRGREIMSLQPQPAGGSVEVSVDLDLTKGRFRVDKRFINKAMARVTDLTHNVVIAQDDEAEAWIRGLTDQGLNGPAGLLWVRQGVTTLMTGDKSENARHLTERRNLLSSVAGEIDLMTGGRRMDIVRDRCLEELGRYATAQGKPRQGGPWKEVRDEIAALTALTADMTVKCAALHEALSQRREIEARLTALQDIGARDAMITALTAAKRDFATAEAHANRIAEARQTVEIAGFQQQDKARRLALLTQAVTRIGPARLAAQTAQAQENELAERLTTATATAEQAEADRQALTVQLRSLRDSHSALRRRIAATEAREKLAGIAARVAEAELHRAAAERADAVLASLRVTPDRVAALDRAVDAVARAQAVAAAQAVTLTLTYDGTARVLRDGQPLPEGSTALQGRTVLTLPGIGQLAIVPAVPAAGVDVAAVDVAEKALAKALLTCGTDSPAAAHQALRVQQDAFSALNLAKAMLSSLAPEGLAALRTTWSRTAEAAAVETGDSGDTDLDPALAAPDLTAPDLTTLDARIATVESAEAEARARVDMARATVSALTAERASARTRAAMAMTALNEAEDAAGDPDTRADRQSDAENAAAQAGADLKAAETALETLLASAPDIATAQAELTRAQSVITQTDREIATLGMNRERLAGVIQTQADAAIEEKLAEAQGALDAATERDRLYTAEVAALVRLRDVLEQTRTAAREAYFGPVQRELQPLLAILSSDAALTFDSDTLLPDALSRQGGSEAVDTLSGGTQEQIAILTRLAFARLFSKAGRPVPVILDDALVHTDDDRIVRMFTALHRVAADQQVIVLTCRQMAFQALGGDRPEVQIKAV